jgi:hypothetical protein
MLLIVLSCLKQSCITDITSTIQLIHNAVQSSKLSRKAASKEVHLIRKKKTWPFMYGRKNFIVPHVSLPHTLFDDAFSTVHVM